MPDKQWWGGLFATLALFAFVGLMFAVIGDFLMGDLGQWALSAIALAALAISIREAPPPGWRTEKPNESGDDG